MLHFLGSDGKTSGFSVLKMLFQFICFQVMNINTKRTFAFIFKVFLWKKICNQNFNITSVFYSIK